jgi:hypothetical protein
MEDRVGMSKKDHYPTAQEAEALQEVRDAKVAAMDSGDFESAARLRYEETQMPGYREPPEPFWDSGD